MAKRTVRLEIRGLTCANCASTVADALLNLDGVVGADVNLATDEGTVEYDPAATSLAEIRGAIADAGYRAVTDTITVGVADMSCANCAETVEGALRDLEGVVDADVNFATDEARVEYVPDAVSRLDLYAAVEDAGYTPVREEGGEDPDDRRDAAREAEVDRHRRRTSFGAVLSAPFLLFLADAFLFGGRLLPETVLGASVGWVEFLLATSVQAVLGYPFYRNAYTALVRNRTANMDVLVALGSSTAYLYSVATLLGPVAGGRYFDTAALILTFITLGNYLETRSKGRASAAIRELLEMEADTATVVEDGTEREIPVEEVAVGDRLKVRPGGRIPTDGEVIEGESAVDESMVTGESVPVEKAPGDEVVGGTINENGVLLVEATKVGEDTALRTIVRTVEEAQSRQPAIQRVADRISSYFVPAVVANALFWAAAWYLFPGALSGLVAALPLWTPVAGGPAVVGPTEFALVVFASAVLIACPCALGLATPAATMVGTAIGAKRGVLFRGGDVLERARDVDAVVFDKTGTLTEGEMRLTDVVAVDGPTPDGGRVEPRERSDEAGSGAAAAVLRLAAGAESGSEHPLGRAVVEGAGERDVAVPDATAFENAPGKGVRATVDGSEVLVGNRRFLRERGVDPSPAAGVTERLEREGKTASLVARDGAVVGVVAMADAVKPTAAEAVAAFRDRGVEVHLVTGDNGLTARAVAESVGIDPGNVSAEVLPEDKAAAVEAIQADGRRAMVVGDGVNDAPALAVAHVGCAVGSGTDVAVEAADVTLMRDDPADAVTVVRVGEGTMAKIRQNLFWALGYNTAMVPLASLGLLQPVLAAGAMAVSSVSVLTNSLLFRRYDPDRDYRLLGRLRR